LPPSLLVLRKRALCLGCLCSPSSEKVLRSSNLRLVWFGIGGSLVSTLSLVPRPAKPSCVVVWRLLLGFIMGSGGDASSCGRKLGGAGRLTAGMLDVLEMRVGSEIIFFVTDFLRPVKAEAARYPNGGRPPSLGIGCDGSVGVETFESAGELSGGVELAEYA